MAKCLPERILTGHCSAENPLEIVPSLDTVGQERLLQDWQQGILCLRKIFQGLLRRRVLS